MQEKLIMSAKKPQELEIHFLRGYSDSLKSLTLLLSMGVGSVHVNFFGIVFDIPDAARTYARADSATDTFIFVGNIFPSAVVVFDSSYRLFGARV